MNIWIDTIREYIEVKLDDSIDALKLERKQKTDTDYLCYLKEEVRLGSEAKKALEELENQLK